MNYLLRTSVNRLYRYQHEDDNGEYWDGKWLQSSPPFIGMCLMTNPEDWEKITLYEAIEQFPEAFQQDESIHS